MKKDKAISKIQKLLALAGNNPNENERARATEAAYEMLKKHNLEMADVVGAAAKSMGPDARLWQQSIKEPWARDVWAEIAELCFCRLLWACGGTKPYMPTLVGTLYNTTSVIDLSNWLVKAIKAEARKTFKNDAAKQRGFCTGAAYAVSIKVQNILRDERWAAAWERLRSARQVQQPGTSVAVVRENLQKTNADIIEKMKETQDVRPPENNPRKDVDNSALRAGFTYGMEDLNVNRQTPESRRIK